VAQWERLGVKPIGEKQCSFNYGQEEERNDIQGADKIACARNIFQKSSKFFNVF
jgi:hypothetical protein